MALVPDQKFSTFNNGGNLAVNDIIVGLRGGLNTKFTYTGDLPPGVIVPIANGGTGASTAVGARSNLGLGTADSPNFNNLKLTGGTLTGTNNGTTLLLTDNASAVNFIEISNNIAANGPSVSAAGSDANIALVLSPKGSAPIGILTASPTQPLFIYNGTGNQHLTRFNMANTAADRSVTFQDASGTLAYLSDIPAGSPSALTRANDTNVTLTLGGTPTTALLQAVSLTMGWTGELSPTRGGTGINNGSNTLTLAGNLATSGAFASTFTMTGVTAVTFPTSGTLATTSQLVTPAALTKTDDTNVTLTLGGSPSTALVNAASLTLGWTGQLGLTRGGSNASLTASNGGIVYSTATAMAILAGTATATQMLQSGASGAPAWSTTTWPATSTVNQLLYSSSANTIAGLATANNGILVTSAGGVPSIGNTVGAGLTMPSITFNTTSGIIGTTTNDNAAAGSVGEFVSSVIAYGSSITMSNGVPANVTSISLGAGDWDVWGNVNYDPGTATIVNLIDWISSTSATLPDSSLYAQVAYSSPTSTGGQLLGFCAPSRRFSLSGTTTIYLSVQGAFLVSTVLACGGIYARRVR